MLKILALFVVSASLAAPAQASVVMKMKQELYGKDKTRTCETVMAVEASRARADSDCGPKKVSVILLNGPKTITMLDYEKRTYFEMSQATLEKIETNPMEALKSDPRYSAQLAKLTPEQKAAMEKMMSGAMKKISEAKTELKKIGKQKQIGNWSCTTYGIYVNGKLAEDLCITDIAKFPELAAVKASWKASMTGWLKMAHSPTLKAHEEAANLGVSVETLMYNGGDLKVRTNLVDVKAEDRSDAFFAAPSDFKKADSPLGLK